MCGIFGKVDFRGRRIDPTAVQRACTVLEHRGPDDAGTYFHVPTSDGEWSVALGHRRLSIIDLRGGHQPMSNEDGTIWITFNGQIYNFQEIKQVLQSKNHVFKTNSDTEVIVHAYEEYGEDCVEHFNGMFAFGIWDERRMRIFLARDRLGIKPLFYTMLKEGLVFASEIKAILQDAEVGREVDVEGLNMYLSLGYILAPHSIVREVAKLEPGHTLTVDRTGPRQRRYWDLEIEDKLFLTEKEYCDKINESLERSVRYRLMSDVPLGAFLSGGIDSTCIVSFMRGLVSGSPKTFSIGFKERTYSEISYARYAADVLSTDHYDLVVEPHIHDLLPQMVWYNDEPLADSSYIPMYFLSELARRHVKVALSGDGGDENFSGYITYVADKLLGPYKVIPRFLRLNFITKFVTLFPNSLDKVSLSFKLKRFVHGAEYGPARAHLSWREIFLNEEKERLLLPGCLEAAGGPDTFRYFEPYFNRWSNVSMLERCFYVDFKTWLVDDILVKVDRASMANSLEVRVPFLDHEFVELTSSIPTEYKLRGLSKKYIFKKAVAGRVPTRIIHKRKEGFSAPISYWLKNELKGVVVEYLSPRALNACGFFNPVFVQQMLKEYLLGKHDHSLKVWNLLNFLLWHEQFVRFPKG